MKAYTKKPLDENTLSDQELFSYLEHVYHHFNDRKYLAFDPIQWVYTVSDPLEQEVVGFLAASLSFGRVPQIFKAIETVLKPIGTNLIEFILNLSHSVPLWLQSFRYRFVSGDNVFNFLKCLQTVLLKYGSLKNFFLHLYDQSGYLKAIELFTYSFREAGYLVPQVHKGSACKRVHMYLRWMIRKDRIDLGLWDTLKPEELIMPIDTHIYQIANKLHLLTSSSISLKSALLLTDRLRQFCPEDPVKYDYGLSHIGIIKSNFKDHLEAIRDFKD